MSELKAKEKLVWLGLTRAAQSLSEIQEELTNLENTVGEIDNFKDHLENGFDWDSDGTVDNIDNFTDFGDYLQEGFGWTETEADKFIEKIKNNFTDEDSSGSVFDEYKEYVLNEADTYQDIKNEFSISNTIGSETETENGGKAAGVKFHEDGGVTKDGINVPSGTTEIFGTEIHFSQSGSTKTQDSGSTSLFTVDNFQTDDSNNVVNAGSSITFSADVTSNSSYVEYFAATLTQDGDSIDTSTFKIGPGNTRTVSFTVTHTQYVCYDYKINSAGPITACWKPPSLTAGL